MKKIMIIGSGGAGKSTLARQIQKITGLELIHLDQIFWKPGWVKCTGFEWIEKNIKILEKESWIIDGNYGSTMDMRLEKADTIIFMDAPTYLRLFRVIKRGLKYYGKTREDMPEHCPEKLDFEFLRYILFYNKTRRPGILEKLTVLKNEKQIFILKNKKDCEFFLEKIKSRPDCNARQ